MYLLGINAYSKEKLMSRRSNRLEMFTVVEVWRGMAVSARNFRRLKNAQKHVQRLQQHRNLFEDDIRVFETSLPVSASR
jgi:hypothetical protein